MPEETSEKRPRKVLVKLKGRTELITDFMAEKITIRAQIEIKVPEAESTASENASDIPVLFDNAGAEYSLFLLILL